MSRIGKLPVFFDEGVQVNWDKLTHNLSLKTQKGEVTLAISRELSIEIQEKELSVHMNREGKKVKELHGLSRMLIFNAIKGLKEGFTKTLVLSGVGYRAEVKGNVLFLSLGFFAPIEYHIPEGIDIKVQDNVRIFVSGIDKQKVGQVSAEIRSLRPVEPYKGKGVKYLNERVRRKAGKSGAKK